MNIFKQFLSLLPARPLQVGEVIAFDAGVATVELPGGGQILARGEATVGQQVFVRDDVIEGIAATMPVDVIEV